MVRPIIIKGLERTFSNIATSHSCRLAAQSPTLKQMGVKTFQASPLSQRHAFSSSSHNNQSHFSYALSASYSGKRQKLDPERNFYNFDPHVKPKNTANKRSRPASGQDAFFISNVADTESIAFGVVDGVGGWEDSGVDPADFAHGLCEYMANASRVFPDGFNTTGEVKPQELLMIGYNEVMEDQSIEAGGSTACVGRADPDGKVEVANLGDSGFVHFGLNAIRFVSPAQTHAFNTPFQLSKLPKKLRQQMALFQGGARHFAESPYDSDVTDHRLRHGDVLLFATDGVWDNLSPSDALDVVARVMTAHGAWVAGSNGMEVGEPLRKLARQSPGQSSSEEGKLLSSALALAVTKEAKETSLSRTRDGPFAKEVHRLYPAENWRGGKADDICVVVLIAIERDGTPKAKL